MSHYDDTPTAGQIFGFGFIAVAILAGIAALGLWGCPRYNVWQKSLSGEALLREAESSRKVAIEEAKAKRESAKLLSEAEVERAKGAAQANQIIGKSLSGNEAYLRYLWIQGLQSDRSQVIYVPTEAGLPILEAGKGPDPEPVQAEKK